MEGPLHQQAPRGQDLGKRYGGWKMKLMGRNAGIDKVVPAAECWKDGSAVVAVGGGDDGRTNDQGLLL